MEKAWLAHREFLDTEDWERSRVELEKVYQGKLDQGIRNHYSYALALIRESQKAAEKGMGMAASELLNYAERMAPDFFPSPPYQKIPGEPTRLFPFRPHSFPVG